jgi:Fe2+ or Zn2+ uptake regulation protein
VKERLTQQRAAVYAVVSAAHDHPTAEQVHARVRRRLPRVSLGTVYRNLEKLAAQQRVRVVRLADHATRYDGMLDEHDHFLCERCGMVSDLLRPPRLRAPSAKLAQSGYTVRAQTVTFYGVCPQCGDPKSA